MTRYSRRCLWLKVGPTNKDSKIIATFYMDAVCQLGGCPLLTRSDPGSENVVVAALQATFREHGDDDFAGSKSHQYGRSVHNQRIEAFWSYLKPRLTYWLEVFQGLVDEGEFEVGNFIQTLCLQYCFMSILSEDLDQYQSDWNDHRMQTDHCATPKCAVLPT
ncbi:uncharacterized protein [Branchiostoma lanceolatum]|uniref:uncharacterized protein n=1 Tax=Branchiostoma lanceolatum TaxID=7740 RepID=UPI003454C266